MPFQPGVAFGEHHGNPGFLKHLTAQKPCVLLEKLGFHVDPMISLVVESLGKSENAN